MDIRIITSSQDITSLPLYRPNTDEALIRYNYHAIRMYLIQNNLAGTAELGLVPDEADTSSESLPNIGASTH